MKTPIKYDKEFQRICKWMLIGAGSLLIIIPVFLHIIEKSKIRISDWMFFLIPLFLVLVPFFIYLVIINLDMIVYFRRLERNHFTIPNKKKDYNHDLSCLPRTEIVENRYAKDSRIAAALALVMYAVFLFLDMSYLGKWLKYVEQDAFALFILLMLLHLYFPIQAFLFHRQEDSSKYVDEVDIRRSLKVRISLVGAVTILLFAGCIAGFSVASAHSMTQYIHHSRTEQPNQ